MKLQQKYILDYNDNRECGFCCQNIKSKAKLKTRYLIHVNFKFEFYKADRNSNYEI